MAPRSTECLLVNPGSRFIVIEKKGSGAANQGVVLTCSVTLQTHTWIRSGNKARHDAAYYILFDEDFIISRLDQHMAGASAAGGSYFYDCCYPSSALPVRGNADDACMGSQGKVAACPSLPGLGFESPVNQVLTCACVRACVRHACVRACVCDVAPLYQADQVHSARRGRFEQLAHVVGVALGRRHANSVERVCASGGGCSFT